MKNDKKSKPSVVLSCRTGSSVTQGARLAAAGYPKFLFRLAAARRAWAGLTFAHRRHD